jgi:hypothetical protein
MKVMVRALMIAGFVLIAAAALWAWQSQTPGQSTPQRWEYRVLTEPAPAAGAGLASLGASGWELVAVTTQDEYTGNARLTRVYYYLKRQYPSSR